MTRAKMVAEVTRRRGGSEAAAFVRWGEVAWSRMV